MIIWLSNVAIPAKRRLISRMRCCNRFRRCLVVLLSERSPRPQQHEAGSRQNSCASHMSFVQVRAGAASAEAGNKVLLVHSTAAFESAGKCMLTQEVGEQLNWI